MSMVRLGRVWCLCLGLFACGDDAASSSGAEDVGSGRGSEACQDWQDAVCDKATSCSADQAQCLRTYRALECVSDTKAQECTLAWQALESCDPPKGCDFPDVSDPAPAKARCQAFAEVLCAARERCEGMVEADCLDVTMTELKCDIALGTGLTFEDCITTLEGECVTSLPESCESVVLWSQP